MKTYILILILHSSFLFFHSSLQAQWKELGGLNGLAANNTINAVCSDASGNFYTAGDFTNSSGYFYIAKWGGTAWSVERW